MSMAQRLLKYTIRLDHRDAGPCMHPGPSRTANQLYGFTVVILHPSVKQNASKSPIHQKVRLVNVKYAREQAVQGFDKEKESP